MRKPAAPAPPDTSPLARYVPKENLVVYCEFSGLDSHEAAWKNTASYKMLNDTTLGEMLGAVSEQLLDKLVSIVPNHRLNGAEIVTLVKHAARSGWVLALNCRPQGTERLSRNIRASRRRQQGKPAGHQPVDGLGHGKCQAQARAKGRPRSGRRAQRRLRQRSRPEYGLGLVGRKE